MSLADRPPQEPIAPDAPDATVQSDQTLGIQLDPKSGQPFFRQIVDQLVQRIMSGELPAGTRLPPSRALAAALDMHRNTVVRAFDELARLGFIAGHVGRGSYVLAHEPEPFQGVREDRAAWPPPRSEELPAP